MRRFLRKFSFAPVVLLLVGFVFFTYLIAKPLRKEQRHSLVTGTIQPAAELRPDAPFVRYVALNKDVPTGDVPEFPVDDTQPLADGKFELSADPEDGTRFYLLARIETAKIERFCKSIALPPMRRLEDGTWVDARTGKPLAPLRITVGKSVPCT